MISSSAPPPHPGWSVPYPPRTSWRAPPGPAACPPGRCSLHPSGRSASCAYPPAPSAPCCASPADSAPRPCASPASAPRPARPADGRACWTPSSSWTTARRSSPWGRWGWRTGGGLPVGLRQTQPSPLKIPCNVTRCRCRSLRSPASALLSRCQAHPSTWHAEGICGETQTLHPDRRGAGGHVHRASLSFLLPHTGHTPPLRPVSAGEKRPRGRGLAQLATLHTAEETWTATRLRGSAHTHTHTHSHTTQLA